MTLHLYQQFVAAAARLDLQQAKRTVHAFRWIVLTLLLAFLVYGLTQLGWSRVWAARPTAPGFYLVLLLQFFVQPAADLVIYRNLLRVGRSVSFLVMLRKRFLNNVMLDYSGEAYFFLWAKRNLDLKKGLLIHAVKDSNVLSAGAGLAMICLMLLALVVGGDTKLAAILPADSRTLALIGSLPILLCLALVTGGSKVTALSRSEVASTFGIHIARSVIALFLEFSAWWLSGALPSAGVCLEFVALRQVVTRLPLIPAKDLFFVGIGMAAAGFMNVSATKVAAALVMMTGFSQLQEFALVGFPWLLEQFRDKQRADQCPS